MPLLSPINHGPLSPAMPSTAGDNIDSEWCCCRLSNYTQHSRGSCDAWLWCGSQPWTRFCVSSNTVVSEGFIIGPIMLWISCSCSCYLWVATFLHCGADTIIQHMTAVSGSLFFEVISRQIFSLVAGPSALEAGDDTHAQQTKCPDHPGFRCPDLGGWLWRITTQGEKECLLCCTRGQTAAPVRVKFNMSHETLAHSVAGYAKCLFFKGEETNVMDYRSVSGLTFCV